MLPHTTKIKQRAWLQLFFLLVWRMGHSLVEPGGLPEISAVHILLPFPCRSGFTQLGYLPLSISGVVVAVELPFLHPDFLNHPN